MLKFKELRIMGYLNITNRKKNGVLKYNEHIDRAGAVFSFEFIVKKEMHNEITVVSRQLTTIFLEFFDCTTYYSSCNYDPNSKL